MINIDNFFTESNHHCVWYGASNILDDQKYGQRTKPIQLCAFYFMYLLGTSAIELFNVPKMKKKKKNKNQLRDVSRKRFTLKEKFNVVNGEQWTTKSCAMSVPMSGKSTTAIILNTEEKRNSFSFRLIESNVTAKKRQCIGDLCVCGTCLRLCLSPYARSINSET